MSGPENPAQGFSGLFSYRGRRRGPYQHGQRRPHRGARPV